MYYNREGQIITQDEWVKLNSDKEYVRIKEDIVGNNWVSTVWLGLDHGIEYLEIFETMVFEFKKDKMAMDINYDALAQYRYATEEEARKGHDEVVAGLEAKIAVD